MTRGVLTALVAMAAGISVTAAELQPSTVAAFDRYVRATETRLRAEPFLWVDRLPASRRAEALALMRSGMLSIDAPRTLEGGREIDVPGGLIHHWVGTAFVPGATIDQTLRLLQDYDRHERIYAPVDRTFETAVTRRRPISLLSPVHDDKGHHRRGQQ